MPGDDPRMCSITFLFAFISLLYLSGAAPPEGDLADDVDAVPPTSNTTAPTPHPTHPPVVIRSRYITKDGTMWHTKPQNESSVRLQATNQVTEEAVIKGAKTMAGMIKHMPQGIFENVARSEGVRLFSWTTGLTIYPEMAQHADTPECHGICSGNCHITCTGSRKLSRIAGLTSGYAYAVDSATLCNNHDGYHGTLNVLAHEFSHLIMFHLPHDWNLKIKNAYAHDHTIHQWSPSYAMTNANEFWAEASGAFFMFTHMLWTSGGMNRCGLHGYHLCPSVAAAREFIHQKDPALYAVLDYVYTNNQPELNERVTPCM